MEQKLKGTSVNEEVKLAKVRKLESLMLLEKIATLVDLLAKDHLDNVTRGIMDRKLDELVKKL